MKIERTKNAVRNIIFGTALKIYQIIIPFLLRTVMIYFIGIEYIGLNSLFVSVLQILNMAELGAGSAMVFSMYKPIADDDTKTICALMKLYRLYYHIIGTVIAVSGLILTPFLKYFISGDVPQDINLTILYLMNLTATVLSYWLFAYKNSIFQAYQRNDIPEKITILTNTFQYALQFAAICIFRNYYLFVMILLLSQIINNIVTAIAADKIYPHYRPQGELAKDKVKEINQRIKDLFTAKIGYVIVTSADTIVISAFLGLKVLAVYQNYYFILTSVIGFITVIFTSVTAGIGNSLIVETAEKNFVDLKKFTFMMCFLGCFCSSSFLSLYQPFMKIWVGEEYILEYQAVIFFVVYFYITEINQLLNTYKDAAGIWHKDRFRPLVTACANLLMNILTVNFLGLYGVILSTVISTAVIGMPWLLYNLFTEIFRFGMLKSYLKKLLLYVLLSLLICTITTILCSLIRFDNILTLIVRMFICLILPNTLFILACFKSEECRESIGLIKNITKKQRT